MDNMCDHVTKIYNVTQTQLDVDLHPGTVGGACVIFLGILPFVLFNFRILPLGSTGALLVGSVLMVSSTACDQARVYQVLGNPGNIRAVTMTLGILIFAQYFQRENLLDNTVDYILDRPLSFTPFLCRATAVTFIGTALLSQDTTSKLLASRILHIWQSQGRPVTELETLLLGISTSANIASVLTVYASVPMAVISSKTADDSSFTLDMPGCFTYLALPAIVGFIINIMTLVIIARYHPVPKEVDVLELVGVEDALITQNAILDNIVEDPHSKPFSLAPSVNITHAYSTDCVRNTRKKTGGSGLHLPNFSVGCIKDKGFKVRGCPSIFLDKEDDAEVNKDQCHSLYNLDKIGYSAVCGRSGQGKLPMPRTVSFYHSFSDLDSWQYTRRQSVIKRLEQDHPRKLIQSSPRLTKRRMSSRGQLETVQFRTFLKHQFPRHRRTSVWHKGLMTDAVRMSSRLGIYRAFSGVSPSVGFLTGTIDGHAQCANIVAREFKASNSRSFKLFLVVAFCAMFALYCVRSKDIHFDIGLLPMAAVTMVMVIDAGWNRRNCTWILRRLNWSVFLTYLALFVFIAAFTSSNLPLWIWHRLGFLPNNFTDARSIALLTFLIIIFSNTIGVVPLTLIVMELLPACSVRYPLVLYLAWGVVLSSNMTLHGSSCSLVIIKQAEDILQCQLSYWGYLRYALPSSCVILGVGIVIIYGMLQVTS